MVEEAAPATPANSFWEAKKGFNLQMLEVRQCEKRLEKVEAEVDQARAFLAQKEEAFSKVEGAEAAALATPNERYSEL